ncbi:glutamine synthetase family protein [Mycobacterium asiaticum]|uniref:Glutamine synthetase n=1 Tax=Mycobacterium asiaticum TaxID=1790 RepID=A0A1A3N599_MYCAS|nr:glutamine synthetase family protein [Mycobacterium asiaticum]OBK15547.1 glutamine synthetase [Mycobacterium asiaticum]
MRTTSPLTPAGVSERLEAQGVDTVIGTVVNPAGLTLAKAVPVRQADTFADPGLGASPSWHAFAIDQTGIAFTDDVGVVGDQRLRIDVSALCVLGNGLAWAPAGFFELNGSPVALCSRGTLRRVENALAQAGITAAVGHELEFVLVDPEGRRLPSTSWAQYGLAGILEHEAFVHAVTVAAASAGLAIEQFHPEYGANQFEISLAPQSPVTAGDQLVLLRIIVARAARQHGLRVSLSPAPFADGVGSGAHQHFSLYRQQQPLFSGGSGPGGMTTAGQSAVAGVLCRLADAQGLLCGSIVSGLRMRPGNWAGAYACWGIQNREAAVRFIEAGPANPQGGNVEVKIVDPSANPYYATAAILGLALEGITNEATLPPKVKKDPAQLSEAQRCDAGIALLPDSQPDIIAALNHSSLLRKLLGDSVIDMVVAVRRMEHDRYGELDPEALAGKFRMAWSL